MKGDGSKQREAEGVRFRRVIESEKCIGYHDLTKGELPSLSKWLS
jgi:hypothetical protein